LQGVGLTCILANVFFDILFLSTKTLLPISQEIKRQSLPPKSSTDLSDEDEADYPAPDTHDLNIVESFNEFTEYRGLEPCTNEGMFKGMNRVMYSRRRMFPVETEDKCIQIDSDTDLMERGDIGYVPGVTMEPVTLNNIFNLKESW